MTECPTCQGWNRKTTDMVCMDCGRDYLQQEPDGSFTPHDRLTPGLGWKRLMNGWNARAKELEGRITSVRAELASAKGGMVGAWRILEALDGPAPEED